MNYIIMEHEGQPVIQVKIRWNLYEWFRLGYYYPGWILDRYGYSFMVPIAGSSPEVVAVQVFDQSNWERNPYLDIRIGVARPSVSSDVSPLKADTFYEIYREDGSVEVLTFERVKSSGYFIVAVSSMKIGYAANKVYTVRIPILDVVGIREVNQEYSDLSGTRRTERIIYTS